VPRALRDGSGNSAGTITTYKTVDRHGPLPRVHGHQPGMSISGHARRVSLTAAAAAVPGLRWPGQRAAGLPLRTIRVERLTQDGVPGSRRGVVLRYGQDSSSTLLVAPYLYVSEARTPEAVYGFPGIGGVDPLPPLGFLQVRVLTPGARTTPSTALVRYRGLYLRVQTNLPLTQLTDIVRRLRPAR
jgi:hypothetical protein